MEEKEFIEAYDRHKNQEDLAIEREMEEYLKQMEELSREQCTEHNVFRMLEYEKLIFNYLAEEYCEITITKKNLLYKLLKEGYNLTDYNGLIFLPSQLAPSNGMRLDSLDSLKPNKNERDKVGEFIANINLEKIGIKTFRNDKSDEIRFMDALVFSLFYIYEDGRIFKIHSSDKYDRDYYKTQKAYKEKKDCYFLVLNKILELFNADFFENKSFSDRLYASAQLHKIDKLFKFFKVYRMAKKKEEILSSEIDRENAEVYLSLGCKKEEDIVKWYDYKIFYDKEFIDFCLETEYPDPFGYLKSLIYDTTTRHSRLLIDEKYNISDFLDEIKKVTKNNIENKLESISLSLWEDIFDPIFEIRNLGFEPKNKSAINYKKSVDQLIKKLYDIKYEPINELLNACHSISNIKCKSDLNIEFYQLFKNIMFVPDKTNFVNLIYNTEYNDDEAKEFLKTDEKTKAYVDTAFQLDKKYNSFWEEYYFTSRNALESYSKSWPESNDDYMKYLFEIVIKKLNEICVLTGKTYV